MQFKKIPVEIISKCSAAGEIIPLRIRMEDDTHALLTAHINEVLYTSENNFAGVKTLDYACRVVIDGKEKLLELRYHVSSHRWMIRKVLY